MAAKIITNFEYPPIPVRDFDWSAVRDGYEPGAHIGRGRTKAAAVLDLLDLEDGDEPAICPGCGRNFVEHQ